MGGRDEWRGGQRGDRPGDMARPLPAPNRQQGRARQGGRQAPPPGYRQRPQQGGNRQPPPPPAGGGHQPPPPGGHRPPPRRGGPPPRRPYRRKRRVGRIIGIFFAVLVLLLAGLWIYIDYSLNRTPAIADYAGRPAAAAGTNWLIVGTDSREGLDADQQKELSTGDVSGAGGGKRTDTMMMLHIPDNGTKPTLVSLLRDSYVNVPGLGQTRLNAAYNTGGAALLTKTVEQNTGMRMDHYAEIGFGGFASVVDSVGGVNICVKESIDDPKAGLNLKPGCQDLNGPQALGYVRTRATPRADYDRVLHQREFLGALMGKASSMGTILNPFKSIPLLFEAPDLLTVGESDHLHHLVGLAFAMKGASDGSLLTTTVPTGGGETTSGGASVVPWDQEKAQELFHALNNDQPVPESVISD